MPKEERAHKPPVPPEPDFLPRVRPAYTPEQEATLEGLQADLVSRMGEAKPKRLAHSLSVARTAEAMALAYGADPFCARCAGILHDWDKVLSARGQVDLARDLGVDLGVDLDLVQPLLHGITASLELPGRYPQLPPAVWRAIRLHTIGAADMTPLDQVVFVADGIEPLRRPAPDIQEARRMVAQGQPLGQVFLHMFASGIGYVVETRRYLYPGTIDIYNQLVTQGTR